MLQYHRAVFIIPVFFIIYLSIAVIGKGELTWDNEIFPFFNWSLFSDVTDVRALGEVEILEVDGVSLNVPTEYYDLPNLFAAAKSRDVTALKLLQKLARAHLERDREQFDYLQRVYEQRYLGGHEEVVYRLVAVFFNPIERWRDGTIREKHVLGQYKASRGQ